MQQVRTFGGRTCEKDLKRTRHDQHVSHRLLCMYRLHVTPPTTSPILSTFTASTHLLIANANGEPHSFVSTSARLWLLRNFTSIRDCKYWFSSVSVSAVLLITVNQSLRTGATFLKAHAHSSDAEFTTPAWARVCFLYQARQIWLERGGFRWDLPACTQINETQPAEPESPTQVMKFAEPKEQEFSYLTVAREPHRTPRWRSSAGKEMVLMGRQLLVVV